MSDIIETEIDFEHYVTATREIVEEFRQLLDEKTAELTRALHEPNKWGESMTMPKAADDPQHHANLHRMRMVCDHFLNVLAGNY
jgi:hypothetical protein